MTDTAALRALLAAATPRPWRVSADEPYEGYVQRRQIEADAKDRITCGATSEYQCLESEPDAALIVAAVNALPALLDEVEALRGALDFIADWAHDCIVGTNGFVDTFYGFADIEKQARAALAEATPDGGVDG